LIESKSVVWAMTEEASAKKAAETKEYCMMKIDD
jgi:hypothetical protein